MGLHGVWQAECLKFDLPKQEYPQRCMFHIGNATAPDSIFRIPGYLQKHLLMLADLTEKTYNATELGTATWLNSNPCWLAYFPEEWRTHMEARPVIPLWHLGYWGQIITARGTFNSAAGTYLREHGTLRYPFAHSWCGISALREHLKQRKE